MAVNEFIIWLERARCDLDVTWPTRLARSAKFVSFLRIYVSSNKLEDTTDDTSREQKILLLLMRYHEIRFTFSSEKKTKHRKCKHTQSKRKMKLKKPKWHVLVLLVTCLGCIRVDANCAWTMGDSNWPSWSLIGMNVHIDSSVDRYCLHTVDLTGLPF